MINSHLDRTTKSKTFHFTFGCMTKLPIYYLPFKDLFFERLARFCWSQVHHKMVAKLHAMITKFGFDYRLKNNNQKSKL